MFKIGTKKVNENFFKTDLFYCKKSKLLHSKKSLKKRSYKCKFIIPLPKPKIIS